MDPRSALLAGDAPLSPRSPLLPFGPSVDSKTPIAAAGAGKCADPESWASDGMLPNAAEHLYHSTFLHIDFLAHARTGSPPPQPSSPSAAAPTAPSPSPVSPRGPLAVSGDAADRVLARMPDEPAALLVIDPAGAIFTDPRAVRAVAAALSVLRKSPRANTPANEGRPPRLQLASAFAGADWAPIAAAFGRMAGLLPDAPADARALSEAVLESARQQYNGHWPLLHLFASRASFFLDVDCSLLGGPGGGCFDGGCGDVDGGRERGGGGGGGSGQPTAAARHVLPGQIETAERLVVGRAAEDPDIDLDDPEVEGFADMIVGGSGGNGGRGHGPDSQSGVARFARDLFGGRGAHTSLPPPAVPPADAESLSLVRRSRSLTEAAQSVTAGASSRQVMVFPGRGSGSAALVAAGPPSAASGRSAGAAATGGGVACSPPAGASVALPYVPMRGVGGTLSAASARSLHPVIPSASVTATAAAADGRGCLSNPSTTASSNQHPASPAVTAAAGGGGIIGGGAAMFAAAMASVASSTCGGGLEGTGRLVGFAVEAARRYAALLEGVGLWAPAAAVLEACVCAAGERWGHRSGRMAALLAQLGRLQQRQGLYRSAEVTLRQALEALESIHGPEGVPVLQCRVALAQVLAALRDADAETMLRAALAALDAALGPTAPETLVAREALAGLLSTEARWMEAEVVYQGLLLAMEEAAAAAVASAPPMVPTAAAGSATAARQRPGGMSRVASQQQLLAVGSGTTGGAQSGGGGGGGGDNVGGAGGGRGPKKSDSRSRLAWGAYLDATGMAAAAAAAATVGEGAALAPAGIPGHGLSGAYHRAVLPPLPSGSGSLPTVAPTNVGIFPPPALPPLPALGAAAAAAPSINDTAALHTGAASQGGGAGAVCGGFGGGGGGRLGPGNADLVAWSGVAAALAEVVAAVQREYGGINDLYDGMHLAGPEGSTAADLAALAAVCPRSGACIAAVVNVRRLTDANALYDVALTARAAALHAAHPALLDLHLKYAHHLSSIGEHGHAEAVCRAALEQLTMAPPPGLTSGLRRQGTSGVGSGSGGDASAAAHPAEVRLRQALGAVHLAAGSLAAATAALMSAVEVAERLVAAGDMAAADARRVEALDCLSGVLWQRAQAAAAAGGGTGGGSAASAATAAAAPPSPSSSSYAKRAIECKRQALELTATVCGERHERVMRGWVALGGMLEAAGDLSGAERAFEAASEVALHRHSRLSAATKAIFRQLQRVYLAQGRTADAQVLGAMYRLKGGLLSGLAPAPAAPAPVPAQA